VEVRVPLVAVGDRISGHGHLAATTSTEEVQMRFRIVVLGLVAAVAALTAGCESTQKAATSKPIAREHTTTTAIPEEDAAFDQAPSIDTPTSADGSGTTTEDPNAPQTTVSVGQTAIDDGVTFKVHAIEAVSSIPRSGYYAEDGPVTPKPGAKLVKVVLTWKNNTGQPVDLFCGGGPATLLDRDGNNYDATDDTLELNGGSGSGGPCGDDVNPGFKQTLTMAFQLPKSALTQGIALWNGEAADDFSGDTFVLFTK
jgi:hypothetical protein